MRTYIFLTAILIPNLLFAQFTGLKYIKIEPAKIVASYSLKYQKDSTNPGDIRYTNFSLFLGPNISKFVDRVNYINDTATRKFTKDADVINYITDPQLPKSGFVYQVYKGYPKGKITFTDHIPSSTYKFEENLDLFHWNVKSDTKTISGFKTQMATCNFGGRSWVAWFCSDLPYSDGPYKFNGLPGLIVKIYDTRNHYVFELVSINKLEPEVMIDIRDKQYINTTKQGFFQAWDSFRADIVNRAKQFGGDSDEQQTLAKNVARDNNPIELIRK